jgi:hypothetical protein
MTDLGKCPGVRFPGIGNLYLALGVSRLDTLHTGGAAAVSGDFNELDGQIFSHDRCLLSWRESKLLVKVDFICRRSATEDQQKPQGDWQNPPEMFKHNIASLGVGLIICVRQLL